MNIVVVESPAKAKTINKYLGPGYDVLASFGHVRDLPAKNGSVDPDADFRMIWEVDAKASKRLADSLPEPAQSTKALRDVLRRCANAVSTSLNTFCRNAASVGHGGLVWRSMRTRPE